MSADGQAQRPIGLLAELTHRCPLGCAYCSNPLALDPPKDELALHEWARVFHEAADLGVLQAHLSGGEPGARRDLVAITAAAHKAGLYTNLITSGVGLAPEMMPALRGAGLDHVQVSIQDSDPAEADRAAHHPGAFARKRRFAAAVIEAGLPLTINCVVHRGNVKRIAEMVGLAVSFRAKRVEIAHVQYYGWALRNRAALMPTFDQALGAAEAIDHLRVAYRGHIVIDAVAPDYHARWPKPCMGGWGRRSLNITPSGQALPCHAAQSIPGLEFWSVRDHDLSAIWNHSPAFNAFRGTQWMKEPCRTCERRDIDFGGCRCQAFALLGDAAAADPVCHLSPHHGVLRHIASAQPAPNGGVAFRHSGRPRGVH